MIANAALGAVVTLLCIVIYVAEHRQGYAGEPYQTAVDGCTVEPGATTVQDLYDAGFILSDIVRHKDSLERQDSGSPVAYLPYDVTVSAEPSTYYHGIGMSQDENRTVRYYGFLLVKDDLVYADISAINEYSLAGTLGDLVVQGISVKDTYEGGAAAQLADLSMGDLSMEALTAAAGKPVRVMEHADGNGKSESARWVDGYYSMELAVKKDGSAYSFSSWYKYK